MQSISLFLFFVASSLYFYFFIYGWQLRPAQHRRLLPKSILSPSHSHTNYYHHLQVYFPYRSLPSRAALAPSVEHALSLTWSVMPAPFSPWSSDHVNHLWSGVPSPSLDRSCLRHSHIGRPIVSTICLYHRARQKARNPKLELEIPELGPET